MCQQEEVRNEKRVVSADKDSLDLVYIHTYIPAYIYICMNKNEKRE